MLFLECLLLKHEGDSRNLFKTLGYYPRAVTEFMQYIEKHVYSSFGTDW